MSDIERNKKLVFLTIEHHLNQISAFFKPGAKLTLLVRHPDIEGGADALLTNDTFPEIVAAIERRRAQEEGTLQ